MGANTENLENLTPTAGIKMLMGQLAHAMEKHDLIAVQIIAKLLYCFRDHQTLTQVNVLNKTGEQTIASMDASAKEIRNAI